MGMNRRMPTPQLATSVSLSCVLTLIGDRHWRSPETIASRKREREGLGRVIGYANERKIRKSFGVQYLFVVK